MFRQLWMFIAQLMVLTIGFAFLMQGLVPFPFDVVLGFVCAISVIYGISSFREARTTARDIRLVRDAGGNAAVRDGDRVAAVGTLRPVGLPLRAPFSRRECVYYRYAASRGSASREGSEPGLGDYSGLALTRSIVRSRVRETHLIGVPILKGFEAEAETLSWDEHYRNAEAYVAETRFDTVSLADLATMMRAVRTTFDGQDGQVRRDLRLDVAGPIRDTTLHELIVPTGLEVCAVGTWSAEHGGLVQRIGTREMLTLYAGGEAGAVALLTGALRGFIRGGVVGVGVAAGLVAWRLLAL